MAYLIYGLAGLFLVLAAAMLFAYHRTGHFGVFIMAVTYAVSGALAMFLVHWWPLVAGFALVWILKLLGLEPRVEAGDDGAKDEG